MSERNEKLITAIESDLMGWYRRERARVQEKAILRNPEVAATAAFTLAMIDGILAGEIEPVRAPPAPESPRKQAIRERVRPEPTRPVLSARRKAA